MLARRGNQNVIPSNRKTLGLLSRDGQVFLSSTVLTNSTQHDTELRLSTTISACNSTNRKTAHPLHPAPLTAHVACSSDIFAHALLTAICTGRSPLQRRPFTLVTVNWCCINDDKTVRVIYPAVVGETGGQGRGGEGKGRSGTPAKNIDRAESSGEGIVLKPVKRTGKR